MFYSRNDWGARKPKGIIASATPAQRTEFIVHHTTGATLGRDDCAAWVRSIDDYHIDHNGWLSIGYNFLVCQHGDVFEGRGWNAVGAHCPGHNTVGWGVAYLGDDANDAGKASIRGLWIDASARAPHPITTHGHREFTATACPGDATFAWVQAGLPGAGAQGTPTPSPHPPPAAQHPWPLPPDVFIRVPTHHSEVVREWQEQMKHRGWTITVDGDYGPKSAQVCSRFQSEKGLHVDGVLGPVTWRASYDAPITP